VPVWLASQICESHCEVLVLIDTTVIHIAFSAAFRFWNTSRSITWFSPLDSLDSFGINTQIGQDSPMSLIDDWGENDPFPLDLGSITSEQLSSIAFLFGGVGDG
jgi:hypothetical protein